MTTTIMKKTSGRTMTMKNKLLSLIDKALLWLERAGIITIEYIEEAEDE